jgi:hypothetical protein
LRRGAIARGLVLAAGLALRGAAARALDVELRAETLTQGYQVRGLSGAPVLSMRRLTQTLSLAGVAPPSDRNGVRVTFRARLRIDSDFGSACDPGTDRCLDELNTARSTDFSPLFARRALDLPLAWVDLEGIGRRRLDLRLGRQLVVDAMGFMLLDGARARLRLGEFAVLEAYGGLEARSGFPLTNGRYERDGLTRVDRGQWDPTLAPQVLDRALAGVVAAALETAGDGPLRARVAWRRVWTAEGVSEEKASAEASLSLSRATRVLAELVYAVPQRSVSAASLAVEWLGPRGHGLGVELSRARPTFDLASIWSSFWVDPTDDLRAHAEVPWGPHMRVTASMVLRRYALSETDAALDDALAAGGGLRWHYRRARHEFSVSATGEGGGPGWRAGVDGTWRAWVIAQRLRADVGLSYWSVGDALRPARDVDSFAVLAGLSLRLGRVATVTASVEDDVNRLVGHRVRAVAVLELRSAL